MASEPLPAERLCWRCAPGDLLVTSSDDLENLTDVVGQERAVAAIQLGLGMRGAFVYVGARNVTDQTARERVSGFSAVVGFKNSPEGSIDAAISAVVAARAPHEFLGVDRHGMTAQLSTTGNDTGHVILRGDKDGPNYSAAHVADTKRRLRALPRESRSWRA